MLYFINNIIAINKFINVVYSPIFLDILLFTPVGNINIKKIISSNKNKINMNAITHPNDHGGPGL